MFDRAKGLPGRATSTFVLSTYREKLNKNLTRFLGDVFVYLKNRDVNQAPGPIVDDVLSAIRGAPRSSPDEPLIVLTHSMGGNIFYDILTSYEPDLRVAAWISVASQVGQFEEMKLFKTSDRNLRGPAKVASIAPRLGYWLNVYDPADMLSFKAAPIFADVKDEEFHTGDTALKAHGAYFKRASFYHMLRERLEGALS